MINGETILIAHLGYPTKTFKAPMIYNPYFEKIGVNAVVVPMGVKAENYAEVMRALFRLTNIRGALVTMPHKVATLGADGRSHPPTQDRRSVQCDSSAAQMAR